MYGSVFNFLGGGGLEELGVSGAFQQADGLGIVIAISQALVDGKAEIEHFAHFDRAVLVEDRALRLFHR